MKIPAASVRDVAVAGAFVLLVLAQPDFGTAVLLAMVAAGIVFLAGARVTHVASLVLAALPALYLLVMRVPYRRARVFAFFDQHLTAKAN